MCLMLMNNNSLSNLKDNNKTALDSPHNSYTKMGKLSFKFFCFKEKKLILSFGSVLNFCYML